MKLMKTAFAVMIGVGLVMASTSAFAQKKKKSKCKDGESDQIASYQIAKGPNIDAAINASLTGKAGNAEKGVKWMTHRRLGNCIACHKISDLLKRAKPGNSKSLKTYGFHGDVGPELDGIASRYSEGELRMLVVNAKRIFPETIMPGFHNAAGTNRVTGDCKGLVVLTAERIEDVVAYLKTLK